MGISNFQNKKKKPSKFDLNNNTMVILTFLYLFFLYNPREKQIISYSKIINKTKKNQVMIEHTFSIEANTTMYQCTV